jgi:hypothetical protein
MVTEPTFATTAEGAACGGFPPPGASATTSPKPVATTARVKARGRVLGVEEDGRIAPRC